MSTDIPKWCRVGCFIDAKDTMNEWCVAEVKDVNKLCVNIILDGWAPKWETSFPIKSLKLAPFRKMSKGYTGPKTKGYRNWEYSFDVLREMQQKIHFLLNGELQCEDAFQTTQYYRGKLFIYIDNLVTQRPSIESITPIINFCSDVIKLIVRWFKSSTVLFPFYYQGLLQPELYLEDNNVALANIWYELLETLRKLFGVDSRSAEFFSVADMTEKEFPGSVICFHKSKMATQLVNFFMKENGFEVILKVIRNEDEKSRVPFGLLNQLVFYEIYDLLDPKFASSFYSQYTESILKRIEIISDAELKDLKHEEIIMLINRMKKFKLHDRPYSFEILKLNFFLKMLRSVYLEKRIKALSEISNMIEALELRESTFEQAKVRASQEEIKAWLINEKILSLLLTDRPHVELMKRSSVILKFFAKHNLLDNSYLEQLWKSVQSKHESYIRATYETIIDLSSVLKETQNDYLFSEFMKVPIEAYEESFLLLIKDFTLKAINTAKTNITFGNCQKWYGISLFKDLMLEKSPPEFRFLSIKFLVQIICDTFSAYQRIECYKLAKELIKTNDSVTQALKLFLSLKKHNPRTRADPKEIKTIEKVYALKEKVIDNLSNYLNSRPHNSSDQFSLPQESHNRIIGIRLEFLRFVANDSNTGLTTENLDTLWTIFTQSSNEDKETFFKWLYKDTNSKPPISQSHIHSMFLTYFLRDDKFPSTCESIHLFNCFSYFFCEANQLDNSIELTEYKQIKYRKTAKIRGIKKLLNIQLHTTNELVMEKSCRLIFAILNRFDSDLYDEAEDIVTEFVDDILKIIQANKKNDNIVMRGLTLIKVLLDNIDEDCEYNSFVYVKKVHGKDFLNVKINQNKTLRHLRKEIAKHYNKLVEHTVLIITDRKITACDDDLPIHDVRYNYIEVDFSDEEQIEYTPFTAISKNQDVIKLLLELLSDANKVYTDLAWKLLLALPNCKSLKRSLSSLKSPIQELVDLSSTHKLLYVLKMIQKQSHDQNWIEKFTKLGGAQYLISIFTDHYVESPVKLVALKEEIIMPVLANIIETISGDQKFVAAFFRSYENVAKAAACGEKLEDEKRYFQSLKKLLGVISKDSNESLVQFLQSNTIKRLLVYIFINCKNLQFVTDSIIIFKKLGNIENCFSHIYNECFALLEIAIEEANKSSGYWDLFSDQISQVPHDNRLVILATSLLNKLYQRQSESNSIIKDEILSGILKVLKSCWVKSSIVPGKDHIDLILKACLCEIPESRSNCVSSPPKCKHPETRSSGFDLLLELCSISNEFSKDVTQILDVFHLDPSWRTSRKSDWNNSPISKEKSQTGFVGLKNLGCTCYMNSILQQLFMISTFRDAILRCPCDPSDDNLLYQLQYVFSGLRSSDKQYINPKGFAKSFKDFEGNPINIIEQMDVDEFFGSFMDKLENLVKNTRYEQIIKLHFGGLQVTELIGKECPHRSERHEPFLSIPVEVKNKRSLQEGLESYVAEEVLEGENSYQCDHCEAKVKAIRRVCVKHLPNYLIIALRRFEFDFDTMSREKLNDYFEFPFELDMEPYTQEGLETEKEHKSADYYKYNLRGIVIHTGTAESGHYYSYILSNTQWVEFNDTWVSFINRHNIPNDCFGGEEKFQYNAYSKITMREKLGNAYMLFYERSENYKPRGPDDEMLETIDLQVHDVKEIEESLEIKKQNHKYWRSKIIFGSEYLSFVTGLSKLEHTDIKFLIKFYLTILIRNKEKNSDLYDIYSRIEKDLKNPGVSNWFLDLISVEEVTKEILIFNPIYLTRRLVVGLIKTALESASNDFKSLFYFNIIQNLKFARKKFSKCYAQYLEVIKLSIFAYKDFYKFHDFMPLIINYLLNRPLIIQKPVPHAHKDIDLGYAEYTNEESFKDEGFYPDLRGTSPCHIYHLVYTYRHLIPDNIKLVLTNPNTITQLVSDCDNKMSCNYLGRLYGFICYNNRNLSNEFETRILESLKSTESSFRNKVLRILVHFIGFEDTLQQEKTGLFIDFLMHNVRHGRYITDNECYISFLYKICSKIPNVLEIVASKTELLSTIEKWTRSNMYTLNPNRNESMSPEDHIKSAYRTLLNKIEKLKNKEVPNNCDSDEEIKQDLLEIGKEIDFLDTSTNTWIKAKILKKAGDIVYISYCTSGEEIQMFKDIQVDEMSLPDTKSNLS